MAGSPDVLSGTFAGRYTIERELGRGATATVYLARDTQRGIAVAVKLMRPELAQSVGADRFLREIRLNEQLHHPHIVPVLDSGEHEGQLFFVLPHMEDGSLRQMLQREKQLPVEAAIAITRTIAQALDYAHQQKLIHRDVKPENILFTSGQACLADFGIARALERAIDESTTDTGLVRGTPAYMSPEQASGSKHYDGRSDQYSLACVLYEMLAGVPAFIGPTPEAVIAQRFQHAPRELRVYRPSVSGGIEAVINRALSISPADRYGTAAEFAAALEAAPRSSTVERRASGPSVGLNRPRVISFLGVAAFLAIGAFGLFQSRAFWTDPTAGTDSSHVAVFPFRVVATKAGNAGGAPHELMQAALRRWQPLRIVATSQTLEAMRAEGVDSIPSLREARDIARQLGAGRFVVGQILQTPTGRALLAEYRDVAGNALYSAQVDLPTDSSRIRAAYDAVVDSLLLRGQSDGATGAPVRSPRHLYATQAFINAMSARDEWALERADSLLVRATELDPSQARAQLWLAQVRIWRGQPLLVSAIDRASAAAEQLSTVERTVAMALSAMAADRFFDACRAYQSLVDADARSFIGWYGLGECRRRDMTVMPDIRSISGWRFRHSYQSELDAYTRAFELLPSTHRGFQAGAYGRLRALLFTSGRTLRRGVSSTGPRREFLASLHLNGDSLVLVPFEPAALAADSRANANPRAIARSRAAFHDIVSRWSAAYPNSHAVKEAVAISLEMQADRSALDSVRVAEQLATDPEQRLRFALFRVLLMVKFGIPDDTAQLHAARVAIDSLLGIHTSPTANEAALLAPVAALSGRCSSTAALLRRAAQPTSIPVRVPADVVGDAQALQSYAQLGCTPIDGMATLGEISDRIAAADVPTDLRLTMEYRLLGAIVAARQPPDSAWVMRLQEVGDYVFQVQADLLSGRRDRARASLRRASQNRREQPVGEVSADAAFPEAMLSLYLGDTAVALANVQSVLSQVRYTEPLAPFTPANNAARLASLVRAMALHAELQAVRDTTEARRWAAAVLALWRDNDEHRELLSRLKSIAWQ